MDFVDRFSNLLGDVREQPWTNLRNKLDDLLKDFPDEEEADNRRLIETRCGKLDKADIAIYGVCPELEELVVVDCRICSKIVKAEAIEYHYESCHEEAHKLVMKAVDEKRTSTAELKKLQNTLTTFSVKAASIVKPGKQAPSGKSSFKSPVSKSKTKQKKVVLDSTIPSSSQLSPPSSPQPSTSNISTPKSSTSSQNKFALSTPSPPLSQKDSVIPEAEKPKLEPVISLVKVEVKDTCSENDTPLSPPQLTPQVLVPPTPAASLTSSFVKTPSKSKPLRNRPNSNSVSNSSNAINNVTSNSIANSSTVNNVSSSSGMKLELDLDKHCGVEENGVPCTLPLSCKMHTLGMKQSVKGRSRKLEVFLAEYVSEKDTVKKKKEIKVVKATPDSTTPIVAPFPVIQTEVTPKPLLEVGKKFTPIVSSPPVLSPALVMPSLVPAQKEETEEKIKKPNAGAIFPTSSYLQERSRAPFFKACFLKYFEDLPRCYWPHHFTRNTDPALPLRTHPFMVCYSLMHRTRRGMKSIRYYTKNYPSGSLRLKKCMNPFTSLSRLVPKDSKPVNLNQVKPVAMCNYNYQKCGGLLYSNRRIHLARFGLQSILLKTSSSNCQSDSSSSTISYMLNNMSSKASLVSRGVPTKKGPPRPVASAPKSVSSSSTSTSLVNFKSVLSQNSPKLAVKNVKSKQFHVPNILGNKRQSENTSKTAKKAKKKAVRSCSSDMNASQMINDFLSKNSSMKQRRNDANVPVLRFAIANGRVEATGDQKTLYSTSLMKDMKTELPLMSNPSTTSSSSVQIHQSSNGADSVGSQQITYLTSPLTFQQISLRLNQLQGKSPNPASNGMMKLVPNPTGGGTLVKVPQSLIFQDKNASG